MTNSPSMEAWNNFVMGTEPSDFPAGSSKRAAAIATKYMSLANADGVREFLECTYELDGEEILEALECVGALIAAEQLGFVLRGLGVAMPRSSPDDRRRLLEQHWFDDLDEYDVLSTEADEDLMRALQQHVLENEEFYRALK